jgi:hypothetical protein
MPKTEYNITHSMKTHGRKTGEGESVTLNVEKRIYEEDADNPLNYTQEQVAHYELQWSEGEVMLIKDGEEIVYSEILGES